jgi:hypothetical protein
VFETWNQYRFEEPQMFINLLWEKGGRNSNILIAQIFLQMALNLNKKKTSSNLCFVCTNCIEVICKLEKSCNSNHQYTFSSTNYIFCLIYIQYYGLNRLICRSCLCINVMNIRGWGGEHWYIFISFFGQNKELFFPSVKFNYLFLLLKGKSPNF